MTVLAQADDGVRRAVEPTLQFGRRSRQLSGRHRHERQRSTVGYVILRHDDSAVGLIGVLVHPTRGSAGAGEVMVKIRGGRETYLAWSEEPLEAGTSVLVVNRHGPRAVDVERWPLDEVSVLPA